MAYCFARFHIPMEYQDCWDLDDLTAYLDYVGSIESPKKQSASSVGEMNEDQLD